MRLHTPYIMHDQVKNLVPSLMAYDIDGTPKRSASVWELVICVLLTSVYLGSL